MINDEMRDILVRRTFLRGTGWSLGTLALNSLLHPGIRAGDNGNGGARGPEKAAGVGGWRGVVQPLHHPARCKRVIFLYQAGGPSHLETFDPKPKLAAMHGQPMPESLTKGQQVAQLQGQKLICFGPQHPFKKWGKAGLEICELFPHLGAVADDICIVRSLFTEQINHDPAHTFMNTGALVAGRPSMGSWLLYGLGAETSDLPGFVVLTSQGRGGQMQPIAARQWSAGFLPSRLQGVKLNPVGDPVLYINNPPGIKKVMQESAVATLSQLNRVHHRQVEDPEILARVAQYEMAFRMQTSVPELLDMRNESKNTLELYGANPGDGSFASNCLLARRLAERGVRFIQLYHRDWDHHGNIKNDVKLKAEEVDRPTAALITDLKQRGMLHETLIVWAGEFGRTPMSQGSGRDHHIKGFSMLLAGGGIKPGFTYGNTDELGYAAVENPLSVHDFHATMLHLLGIDHERMTVKFQGLDARLTGVEPARVAFDLLA